MTDLHLGDQSIRHDRDATARIYQALEQGFAEKCGCAFCRNFAAQREAIYPPSFRALLEQLGIDPNKEGEAFEYGPVELPSAESPHFESFFTTAGPRAPAFRDKPRLSIEFATRVKWVLAEDARPSKTPGKT